MIFQHSDELVVDKPADFEICVILKPYQVFHPFFLLSLSWF